QATVVKAREFPVPGEDRTAASIVVGPDGNLWFTELRHIGTMSPAGQLLHDKLLKRWQSIPGTLINRQDGYIWANTATRLPPRCRCPKCAPKCSLPPMTDHDRRARTPYQLFKISTTMDINTISLPSDTFLFPTNLVRIDASLYTGRTTFGERHGSDVESDDVDHVNEEGAISKLFSLRFPTY